MGPKLWCDPNFSPFLNIYQYLLCLGLKMVLGSLSRSLALSRSRWLLGDERSCVDFSLLKRSRPVLRICSSSFWWRFISESTLSSRAVRFTEERAEEPKKSKAKTWPDLSTMNAYMFTPGPKYDAFYYFIISPFLCREPNNWVLLMV